MSISIYHDTMYTYMYQPVSIYKRTVTNLTVCQSIVSVIGELLSGVKDLPRQSTEEHYDDKPN